MPGSPVFDSVIKALTFAFNDPDPVINPPTMNRMMAAVKGKEYRRAQVKPLKDGEEARRKPSPPLPQPGEMLKGLNRAAQAGFILSQVSRLDRCHQCALEARLTRIQIPCACKSPCCRGFKISPRWSRAIDDLTEIVKDSGDVMRIPGKKGLSTDPRLRRLIIERFFNPADLRSVAVLSRRAGVSSITAAKHTEWIGHYLEQTEGEALSQIAAIFDQSGITGVIEEITKV